MKRTSKLIAKRLRPSLARFPTMPEKSFERKASRNNCANDNSPPEKSCKVSDNGGIAVPKECCGWTNHWLTVVDNSEPPLPLVVCGPRSIPGGHI